MITARELRDLQELKEDLYSGCYESILINSISNLIASNSIKYNAKQVEYETDGYSEEEIIEAVGYFEGFGYDVKEDDEVKLITITW